MATNVSVQCNGGFLPDIRVYTVDPILLPSGNPIKCHEEVLSWKRPVAIQREMPGKLCSCWTFIALATGRHTGGL